MTQTSADILVLIAKDKVILNDKEMHDLEVVGCRPRYVELIRNDNYKIRVWQLHEYTKIIYIDPEMLVLKNIDELFTVDELSAVRDYENKHYSEHQFTNSLMLLKPTVSTFENISSFNQKTGNLPYFFNRFWNEPKWLPIFSNVDFIIPIQFPSWWALFILNESLSTQQASKPPNFFVRAPANFPIQKEHELIAELHVRTKVLRFTREPHMETFVESPLEAIIQSFKSILSEFGNQHVPSSWFAMRQEYIILKRFCAPLREIEFSALTTEKIRLSYLKLVQLTSGLVHIEMLKWMGAVIPEEGPFAPRQAQGWNEEAAERELAKLVAICVLFSLLILVLISSYCMCKHVIS
eukprot:TRINITY_DN1246_c1_g1_i3.p1 TRINITY_DN1246_c1_g1~~TRINITY_DN1246_c1_g1_i3.p1  ORF type:complete len:351 (-),score=119.12 TRINITY_DN1246_c1_g1_i3:575-1627(-)